MPWEWVSACLSIFLFVCLTPAYLLSQLLQSILKALVWGGGGLEKTHCVSCQGGVDPQASLTNHHQSQAGGTGDVWGNPDLTSGVRLPWPWLHACAGLKGQKCT